MGVRIINANTNNDAVAPHAPEWVDSTQDQREATVDGQTHHFAPNQVKNFADEGVGAAIGAFKGGATIIQEDEVPFGSSRS